MAKRVNSPTKDRDIPPVGSRVKLLWGGYPIEADVIEDRGHLGVGGRRILRIRLDIDPRDIAEPIQFEIPVEELTPVKRRARKGARKRVG